MKPQAVIARKTKNIVMPRPSMEELDKAWEVVDAWFLHFYQLLFFHNPKLTEPGNGHPFNLERSPKHSHCIQVEVQPYSGRMEDFDFLITPTMTDKELLGKCQKILDAITLNKQKVHELACCPLAAFSPCVCAWSFICPIHGEKHIGWRRFRAQRRVHPRGTGAGAHGRAGHRLLSDQNPP